MFDKFNNSARAVVFRARDIAVHEGSAQIEPHHIQVALRDPHPELFTEIVDVPTDGQTFRQAVALAPNPTGMPQARSKMRFSSKSKRVLLNATQESRSRSQHCQVDERHLLLGLLRTP